MSEWQGLWKCEKCGKSGTAMWREMVTDRGRHYLNADEYCTGRDEYCTGRIVPFDRRAPDPDLLALLREAREALEQRRRGHYYCEDTWYACPKSEEGCADEDAGSECNCGADELNAALDVILARIDAKLKEVGG